MSSIKDQAITLRRLDYSETSQVLVVFTRDHGKVRVIGKGLKKSTKSRFSTGIDLLEAGHVVLSVRGVNQDSLSLLTEWKQLSAFTGLRGRLDRLYGGQYGAVVTSALTEDWDPHPVLYDSLLGLLGQLENAEECVSVIADFQQRLLVEVGSVPEFSACVGCGGAIKSDVPVHFSSFDGGLLCRDCEGSRAEKVLIRPDPLRWLNNREGGVSAAGGAFKVLDYHISHLMGCAPVVSGMFIDACRQSYRAMRAEAGDI